MQVELCKAKARATKVERELGGEKVKGAMAGIRITNAEARIAEAKVKA